MKARIKSDYDRLKTSFKGHEDLLFAAADFFERGQYEEGMAVVSEDTDVHKETMFMEFSANRLNIERCEYIAATLDRIAQLYIRSIVCEPNTRRKLMEVMISRTMYVLRPVFRNHLVELDQLVQAYFADDVQTVSWWLNTNTNLSEPLKKEITILYAEDGYSPDEAFGLTLEALRIAEGGVSLRFTGKRPLPYLLRMQR